MPDSKAILLQVRQWKTEMDYRYSNLLDKEYMGIHWPKWSKDLQDILDGKESVSNDANVNKKLY